jgi:hypothetical protein
MNNGDLIRALHKIKRFDKDVWCGYLTPSEILTLVDNGIQVQDHDEWMINYAKEKKKKGECHQTWFYFKLGKLKDNPHMNQKERKKDAIR